MKEIDKDEGHRIRREGVATIDDGCTQDEIMAKELTPYGEAPKPVEYKVYTVTGEFKREDFDTCKFSMNIIATDKQIAMEVCREHASMADGFDKGAREYLEDEEISECITILDVKEYSTEVFQGEVFGTITLLTGSYFENFIEPWEDVIKRVTDEGNNDYPRFRVMSVHVPNTLEDHIFFYKSNKDNKENHKAILSCERRGIDPFGY